MLSELADFHARGGQSAATPQSPQVTTSSLVRAANLRAKAQRYRALVEGLFDSTMIAIVQACARELEAEAAFVEFMASRRTAA